MVSSEYKEAFDSGYACGLAQGHLDCNTETIKKLKKGIKQLEGEVEQILLLSRKWD